MEKAIQIKFSELLNQVSLLGLTVETDKKLVNEQTKLIMHTVNEMVKDIPNKDKWKSYADLQEVFIEPVSVHAYVKLVSTVSTFITAYYLNNTALTQAAVMTIKGYLNKTRKEHGLRSI